MKKKLMMILLLLWFLFAENTYAAQTNEDCYDIFEMDKLEEYGDFKSIFRDAVSGDMEHLLKRLSPSDILLAEVRDSMGIMKGLLLICMINGMAASLETGEGSGAGYMAFMAGSVLAAGLCLRALGDVIGVLKSFAGMYLGIVGAAVPVTAAVLTVSGRASLAGASSALIYAACGVLTAGIKTVIVPCIGFYAVCGIINCISPRGMLTKLSAAIKSFVSLGVRFCALAFGVVIGFERAVTAGTDGLLHKTALSAVKAVPVAGDIFAAGADSVMALMSNVKSGLGGGLIILMLVCSMVPLAKVLAISGVFKACAVLAEPMGDKRISDMIETAGTASALAFTVMFCLVLVFAGSAAVLLLGMGG
ncbi:MAG: hypothetical protein IKS17_02915 [Firmicutes bacterium]|nr:hypothetical protein [Bacillota bacterium]